MRDAEERDQERKDREDPGWMKPEKFESGKEKGMHLWNERAAR